MKYINKQHLVYILIVVTFFTLSATLYFILAFAAKRVESLEDFNVASYPNNSEDFKKANIVSTYFSYLNVRNYETAIKLNPSGKSVEELTKENEWIDELVPSTPKKIDDNTFYTIVAKRTKLNYKFEKIYAKLTTGDSKIPYYIQEFRTENVSRDLILKCTQTDSTICLLYTNNNDNIALYWSNSIPALKIAYENNSLLTLNTFDLQKDDTIDYNTKFSFDVRTGIVKKIVSM